MITIPFTDLGKNIPAVAFTLGEDPTTYYALLDTGTETTLFDWSLRDKEGVDALATESSVNFINVGGESPHQDYVPVSLDTRFNSNKDSVSISGILYDLSIISNSFDSFNISGLIGSDFFESTDAVINYDEKTLCIK